jgi:hypothetical protein
MLKAAISKHQQEAGPSGIAGDLLLFKKGTYERGRDKIEVPIGTTFRPNPFEFWHGWQKFKDGGVAGLQLCRFYEGLPASRNDLDDLEESEWEDERDPWQENYRIVMKDEFGDLVTFSTISYGGKLAWEELLEAYRADISDLWPVVAAKVVYYDTKMYRHIPRPHFEIVAWNEPWAAAPANLLPATPATSQIEAPKPSSKTKEGAGGFFDEEEGSRKSFEEELDAEIQF